MSGGMVGARHIFLQKNTSFNNLKNVRVGSEEGELEKLQKEVSLFVTNPREF